MSLLQIAKDAFDRVWSPREEAEAREAQRETAERIASLMDRLNYLREREKMLDAAAPFIEEKVKELQTVQNAMVFTVKLDDLQRLQGRAMGLWEIARAPEAVRVERDEVAKEISKLRSETAAADAGPNEPGGA